MSRPLALHDRAEAAELTALCLRYLLQLRVFGLLGQGLLLAVIAATTEERLPWLAVAGILGGVALLTAGSAWRLRARGSVSQAAFVAQLLVDILALAALVYFTGGSSNPLVSLFLLPVVVAAAVLRARWTWLLVLVTAGLYTALMFLHVPTHLWHHAQGGFEVHLWGMWFGFLMSAALVAFFVTRLGAALRGRDRALAAAREQALEAEQMLALGTLAAGTAHELGSPLATMALVTRELQEEHAGDPGLAARLGTLRRQVDRCKEILVQLAADAGQAQALGGSLTPVDAYLGQVTGRWRERHPDARLDCQWQGPRPAPAILGDKTLEQAIANVLTNAATASGAPVQVRGQWTAHRLELAIQDQGPGLGRELETRVGREPLPPRPEGGLGWGLYLARATLERLGGSFDIRPGEHAGLVVTLALPLVGPRP